MGASFFKTDQGPLLYKSLGRKDGGPPSPGRRDALATGGPLAYAQVAGAAYRPLEA